MEFCTYEIFNVVIIRFSLRYDENKLNLGEREEWFKYRAKIFEYGTLKSLLNNSVAPKLIIVLCDGDDRELFAKYLKLHDTIKPVFSNVNDYNNEVMSIIKSYKFEHLIISRVDSDDLVKSDYFEKIRNK